MNIGAVLLANFTNPDPPTTYIPESDRKGMNGEVETLLSQSYFIAPQFTQVTHKHNISSFLVVGHDGVLKA